MLLPYLKDHPCHVNKKPSSSFSNHSVSNTNGLQCNQIAPARHVLLPTYFFLYKPTGYEHTFPFTFTADVHQPCRGCCYLKFPKNNPSKILRSSRVLGYDNCEQNNWMYCSNTKVEIPQNIYIIICLLWTLPLFWYPVTLYLNSTSLPLKDLDCKTPHNFLPRLSTETISWLRKSFKWFKCI